MKHGFFRARFMLCDRCVQKGEWKQFRVGFEYAREKRVFGRFVKELCDAFELESVVDHFWFESFYKLMVYFVITSVLDPKATEKK
ncbi:MAG: hypothetical protein ACOWW1_00700 [archaeon]